ncbi:MAG: hypothetical protein NVS9B11_16570 [Candidatus Dormibacteraceae bacterium]
MVPPGTTKTKGVIDLRTIKVLAVGITAAFMALACGSGNTSTATSSPKAATAVTADSKAADLRVALDNLLGEHIFMAAKATGAALRGGTSDPEFVAAGAALNTNGTDIGAAVGSLYGTDAQNQFNAVWSAHNGFFVDYTIGVATKDATKKGAAVDNLKTKYITPFSAFLSGATGIPQDALAGLLTTHILTTAAIVDDQGAKDWAKASADDRTAAHDMQMIADPLGAAFVKKFPAKFTS